MSSATAEPNKPKRKKKNKSDKRKRVGKESKLTKLSTWPDPSLGKLKLDFLEDTKDDKELIEKIYDLNRFAVNIEDFLSLNGDVSVYGWQHVMNFALYEKYNFLLPLLKQNLDEEYFKEMVSEETHGLKDFVYVYCTMLTLIMQRIKPQDRPYALLSEFLEWFFNKEAVSMAIAEAIKEFCSTNEAKGFIVHPKGEKPKKTSKPSAKTPSKPPAKTPLNLSAKTPSKPPKRKKGTSATNRSSTAKKKTFSGKIIDFVNKYKATKQGQPLDINTMAQNCFAFKDQIGDARELWTKIFTQKLPQLQKFKIIGTQTTYCQGKTSSEITNKSEQLNEDYILPNDFGIDFMLEDIIKSKEKKEIFKRQTCSENENGVREYKFTLGEYLCVMNGRETEKDKDGKPLEGLYKKNLVWKKEVFSQKYKVNNNFNLYLFAVVVKTKKGDTGHYVVLLNCSDGWVKVDDEKKINIDTKIQSQYKFKKFENPSLMFFRPEAKQTKSKEEVRGIVNPSNQCYINALMQVVAHMSELFVGPVVRGEKTVKPEVSNEMDL